MKLLRFFAAVIGCSLAFQAFALPQNDAAQAKRVRIALEDAVSMRIHGVEAEYPKDALADHVSGPVFLSIVIDRQGKVIEAAPVARDEWPPNWSFSEDARLRDAAIQAVKQWEYNPYFLNGQPAEVETRVVVKFKTPYGAEGRPSGGIGAVQGGSVGGVPGGLRSGGVIGGMISSPAPPYPARPSTGGMISSPPPQYPARPSTLRVSSKVLESNLLKHVDPVYPSILPNAPMHEEVRLLAMIGKTGVIVNLRAISGHPILLQAAMDAVLQWKYKPFLLNGEPVEAEGEVIVVFKR